MLLFNILCASVIVCMAWAHIPYHELDIKLFDSRGDSLATALSRNLDEVKTILTSSGSKNTVKLVSVVKVPGVSDVAKVVSLAQSALSDSTWKDILIQTIDEHNHRGIMESKIQDIKACIATIQQKIRILENQNNLSGQDKSTIIYIIENEISKMINFFAASDSIFRKHAQFAFIPLSVLTPIVTVFEPLMEDLAPELARQTFTACKFTDILKEYCFIVAVARLNAIKLKYYEKFQYHDIDASPLVSDVMSRPYNSGGYHKEMDSSNGLEHGDCKSANSLQVCLKDTVGDQEFHIETISLWSDATYPGALRYMEEVRFRIEEAFNKLIDLASRVCPDERRSQRILTREGWLTVFVPCAVAKTKWQSNKRCDGGLFKSTECEAYVKISIDGVENFRTTVKSGLPSPTVNPYTGAQNEKTFNMGLEKDKVCFAQVFTLNKYPRTASIKLELWDEDDGTDDLLLTKQTTIENLAIDENIADGSNSMQIISFWKNAFNDN